MKKEWTARASLFFLIGSTTLTLSLSVGGFFLWNQYRHEKLTNPKYKITSVIQTGPVKEALKTSYLVELLQLSIDSPSQLYAFNLKEGEARLLASPLIRAAKIKRMPPEALYIDYEVRKPVALLSDFQNTGVDREGYLFPIHPFFSPKKIPKIFLGITSDRVKRVEGPHFELALGILDFLEAAPWEEGIRVVSIDVSKAFNKSLGQREIVMITEEEVLVPKTEETLVCTFPKIIRLSPKDYPSQLVNFFQLQKTMMDDYRRQLLSIEHGGRFNPRIVDLRIPQLAFVEK